MNMNTYNHHKVIDKVSEKLKNNLFDVDILQKASDFTDDFCDDSEWECIKKGIANLQINQERFFYFHFYYDLIVDKGKVGKGTISLFRRNENNTYNQIEESMSQCDYNKIRFEKPLYKAPEDRSSLETQKNYKKFFTFINGRESYLDGSVFDSSNQSDCVAFLHAMGAKKDSQPETEFENHLKKCFTEFLFLEDDKDALFILGIALHSIMDSFTPSHMGFQKYTEQDMAKHAQGDVIVFDDDYEVTFDPGQYTADGKASNGKTKMAAFFKGFDSNDKINDKEFEMFKIFTEICALKDNETIKRILDGSIELARIGKYNYKTDSLDYEPRSLKVLNDTLLKDKQIKHGKDAFLYANATIKACEDVFQILSKAREEIGKNYENYKTLIKGKESVIDKAFYAWKVVYDSMKNTRDIHINKRLYTKDPSLMERIGQSEMAKPFGGMGKL